MLLHAPSYSAMVMVNSQIKTMAEKGHLLMFHFADILEYFFKVCSTFGCKLDYWQLILEGCQLPLSQIESFPHANVDKNG